MPQITTIDICLAPSANSLGAPVLLTVTDDKAAQAIVDAVNAAPKFQGESLVCFANVVDRTGAAVIKAAPVAEAAPVADEPAEG
jgi:hypothetical protein